MGGFEQLCNNYATEKIYGKFLEDEVSESGVVCSEDGHSIDGAARGRTQGGAAARLRESRRLLEMFEGMTLARKLRLESMMVVKGPACGATDSTHCFRSWDRSTRRVVLGDSDATNKGSLYSPCPCVGLTCLAAPLSNSHDVPGPNGLIHLADDETLCPEGSAHSFVNKLLLVGCGAATVELSRAHEAQGVRTGFEVQHLRKRERCGRWGEAPGSDGAEVHSIRSWPVCSGTGPSNRCGGSPSFTIEHFVGERTTR